MKYALITGAAGGIGAEVARRLSQLGYGLLLVDINEAALAELETQLPNAEAIVADMNDADSVKALCSRILNGKPQLEVAFVNAGIVVPGNVLDLEPEQIDAQLNINLVSAIHIIRACAKNMQTQQAGHIITTVSMGGIIPLKGSATYAATKFGLRGFLAALSEELLEERISVSGIYPSGVDTAMLRHEATNNGSVLNFLSEPQSIDSVANAVVHALKSPKLEIYLPYFDSIGARLIGFFPRALGYLYPALEKMGERGRQRYLKRIDH
ncbi:MAG: SDR family oxidoreductase [Pseudomonadales bacterium]|nr:SDR family oxidoreductase [Pseudomonadales bacterium]